MAQWSTQSLLNFISLALIRGCTPIMMYLAVYSLHSASLVVVVKSSITLLMFGISLFWFYRTDLEVRRSVTCNLRERSTYWKVAICGLLQNAIPNMLLIYCVKYLPPTLIAVATVTLPWWSLLVERLPFVRMQKSIHWVKLLGMACGLAGTIVIYIPIIIESLHCFPKPEPSHSNNGTVNPTTLPPAEKYYDSCLSGADILNSTCALIAAPVIWGAVKVFWKLHQKDIHYLVSSMGQNFVGALFALFLWLIAGENKQLHRAHWNSVEVVTSLLFLGVITGWMATLLVHNLFFQIGAITVNQVMITIPMICFVLDCVFVNDVITSHTWLVFIELAGVIIVSVGVFLSVFPQIPTEGHHPVPNYDDGDDDEDLARGLLASDSPVSEGLVAGLEQIQDNNIHRYHDDSHVDESEETDEEINSQSNPSLPPIVHVT